jgi:hypothetical protein
MSQGPSTHPARVSAKAPRARFNWPPTDDELAQYGVEGPPGDPEFIPVELETGEPVVGDEPPAPATVGLFPSETGAPALSALPPDAFSPSFASEFTGEPPAASFTLPEPEPFRAAPVAAPESWTPEDWVQTPFDGEALEDSRRDAPPASGIAVSPGAAAVDAPGTDDLAGEIAQLQALIEALTQKIEWRIPNVTGLTEISHD